MYQFIIVKHHVARKIYIKWVKCKIIHKINYLVYLYLKILKYYAIFKEKLWVMPNSLFILYDLIWKKKNYRYLIQLRLKNHDEFYNDDFDHLYKLHHNKITLKIYHDKVPTYHIVYNLNNLCQ